MRIALMILIAGLVAGLGCSKKKPATVSAAPSGAQPVEAISVTPAGHAGRVATVNPSGRFVVVTFPMGSVPAAEQRLGVYREGLKVAELKFGNQRLDNNAVADIEAGEVRVGDEVRAD